MAQFDPSDEDVDATLKHLEKADAGERKRVLAAELAGKKRKTVLEKYGIDPDARYGKNGRLLYPWEPVGDQKVASRALPEDDDAKAAREAQLEQEQLVAAATPQLGSSAAGSGSAPAAQSTGGGSSSAGAAAPASSGGTAGGTAGGAGGAA